MFSEVFKMQFRSHKNAVFILHQLTVQCSCKVGNKIRRRKGPVISEKKYLYSRMKSSYLRTKSSYSLNRPGEKYLARQGIESILSTKQQRRPLPSLLYKSFFYALTFPEFCCTVLYIVCTFCRIIDRDGWRR